jgi:hypothetical protein
MEKAFLTVLKFEQTKPFCFDEWAFQASLNNRVLKHRESPIFWMGYDWVDYQR